MLALPLQRGAPVDTVPVLAAFVNTSFGAGSDVKFEGDLAGFQRARHEAIAVTESTGESGLTTLSFLIFQLKSMAPRLAEYENDLKLLFTYQDAFKPTKGIRSKSLYYDLATFLWNYAALHSQIGSRVDRSNDDGIRVANKHFQSAAGALNWIADSCIPNISGEDQFGPINLPVLRMMGMLMLAQAQLCFYEKTVRDRKNGLMKAGIVAKLAAQTSLYYKAAQEMSTQGGCVSYIDQSWSCHAQFQSKCFLAASEYWQSQASKEEAQSKGTGYGEEIARLARSLLMLDDTIAFANAHKLGVSLTNGAAGLQRSVLAAKVSAENDNRRVYMESVPEDGALGVINPVAMAKAIPLAEYTGEGSDMLFFRDIQPKAVKTLIRTTREDLDLLLSQVTDYANTATNEGRRQLSAVGLPASLETFKSGGEFPANLWLSIQRVQSLGGIAELESRYIDVESSAQRAGRSMENISASIAQEERVDVGFRSRFPSASKVTPSSALNADIKLNVVRLREAYNNARNSDAALSRDLRETSTSEAMRMIGMNKEELSNMLPKPVEALLDFHDDGNGSNQAVDTSLLEAKLFEMAGMIEGRDLTVESLRGVVSRDIAQLLSSLPLSGDQESILGEYEAALAAHVQEAKNIAVLVQESTAQQEGLVSAILAANEVFIRARRTDPTITQRDDMLQSLAECVSKFFTIHSQLSSGATFYSNLQTRLTSLLQSSDDLSYTQQLVRQDYEKEQLEEYERSTQEKCDREYAENLSLQMEALNTTSVAPTLPLRTQPHTQHPLGTAPSAPATNIVYGQRLGHPGPTAYSPYPGYAQASPQAPSQQYPPASGYPALYPQHAQQSPQAYPSLHPPYQSQPQYAPQYAQPPQYSQPQYAPQQGHGQHTQQAPAWASVPPAPVTNPKVARLLEMGFPHDRILNALAVNGGKEEETLQTLLNGP